MILSIDPIDLNIASIIRATRKQFGHSQTDLAKKLGLTQSTYSRAENCKSLFNVFEWDDFCTLFSLHHHCYKFGYIDQMSFKPGTVVPNNFHLPRRYQGNDITVQDVIPTLQFFAEKLGRNTLIDILKSYGIDPDYFIYRFNKLSIQFQIDLTKYLIQTNTLTKETMPELTHIAASPFSLASSYDTFFKTTKENSIQANIKNLVKITQQHQTFSDYQVESIEQDTLQIKRHFNIAMVDKNNFKYDSILGNYFCEYFQGHVKQIANLNLKTKLPITITHTDCFFKGAKECKYQIRVA